MNREVSVPRTEDFCMEHNIPFNSEEQNLYRAKQNQMRFKQYAGAMNRCFETSRPTEFKTGTDLLAEKKGAPPLHKVTEAVGDGRLYVPNVFQQAHQKFVHDAKLGRNAFKRNNKILSKVNSFIM